MCEDCSLRPADDRRGPLRRRAAPQATDVTGVILFLLQRRHRAAGPALGASRTCPPTSRRGARLHPDRVDGPPALDGVAIVLVRLLGGRRAWEDGFDDLRAACRAARHPAPRVRRRGRARRRADRAVDRARGVARRGASPTWPPAGPRTWPTCCASWPTPCCSTGFGFDPPVDGPRRRRSGTVPASARPAAIAPRPAARRRRLLPGPPRGREHAVRRTTCATRSRPPGADAVAIWCYSLRGRRPTARVRGRSTSVPGPRRRRGRSRRRWPHRRRPDGSTATAGRCPALAALGVPVIQAPSTCTITRRAGRPTTPASRPLDVAMGVAIPEFDGRIIGPPFSFKEVVDDGDDLGAPVTAYRTDARPRRPRRRHRRPPGPPAPHARRRASASPSCCPPTRPSAAASATPSASTRRRRRSTCCTPCAATGYRVDRIPADGDALMAELADGFTYDADRR